jgi:hypothetical protein
MSEDTLAKIKSDALALLGKVVAAYTRDIEDGEVGADGSARASSSKPTKSRPS